MANVIYNKADKERLYADLHELTCLQVEGATLETVKRVLFQLASDSGYDRASLALKLHWMLISDYLTMSPTHQYLEQIRRSVYDNGSSNRA